MSLKFQINITETELLEFIKDTYPSDTNEKVAVKVPSAIHLLTPYGFLLASASVWKPYGFGDFFICFTRVIKKFKSLIALLLLLSKSFYFRNIFIYF